MGEGSSIPRNAKPMPSLMLDGSSQIPAEAQDLKRKAMIRGELSYRPSFFTVVVFVTIAFLMLKCAVHLAAHRPKSVRFLAGGDNEQLIPLLADGSSGSDECDGEGSRGASGARPKEGRRNQRLGWKLWKTGTPTPKYKRQKDDDDSSPLQKPSTMKEPEQEDNDDSSRLPKPSTSKEPKDTSRRPPTFPLPKPSTSKEPEDASRRPPTFPQRGGRSRLTIKGMKVGDPGSSHYEEISLPFSHPLIGVGKKYRGLRNIMEKAGTTASSICFPHKKIVHTHYTAWVSTDGGEEIEVHIELEEIGMKRASPWTRLKMLLSLTRFDHRHFRRDVEASLEKMVANVLRDVEEGTSPASRRSSASMELHRPDGTVCKGPVLLKVYAAPSSRKPETTGE